jgi:hypothetical protein
MANVAELREKIKQLRTDHITLRDKLTEVIIDMVRSQNELIAFIREYKLPFTHPGIKLQSKEGPIIGYDQQKGTLWILQGVTVLPYDSSGRQFTDICSFPLRDFLEKADLVFAHNGLAFLEDIVNEHIKIGIQQRDAMQRIIDMSRN